jgi:hypothetical protein
VKKGACRNELLRAHRVPSVPFAALYQSDSSQLVAIYQTAYCSGILKDCPRGCVKNYCPFSPHFSTTRCARLPVQSWTAPVFAPHTESFFIYGVYGTRHFHTVSGASFDVWHIGLYIPLFASALWASWQEAPVLQKACGLSQSPCLSCPSNLMHAHISVLLGSLLSLFKSFRLCSLRGLSISLTST